MFMSIPTSRAQGRRRARRAGVAAVAIALMAPAAALATSSTAQAFEPFPPDYATWHRVDTPGGGAWKLTSDDAGDIWYTDDIAGEVVRLVPGTGGKTVFPMGTGPTRIVSMVASPDGTIWWGDAQNRVVRRLDPTTGAVDTFPLIGRFPSAPESIAVDEIGNVWFGGWNGIADPNLTMIRPDGTSTGVASPTGHMIEQVTVAPDGRVWFTEEASPELGVYDPIAHTYSTVPLGAVAPGRFWDAIDVEISAGGEIWAATDKGVAKIAPDGTLLTVAPFSPRTLPVTPRSLVAGEFAEMYFADGEGGLARIDATGKATFFQAPFSDTSSYSVAVDRFGALWTTLDGTHLGWV